MSWTEDKNNRRCDLIDKQIEGTISPEESKELESLQQQMLSFRNKHVRLPIEELRAIHKRLLDGKEKEGL